jgi:hypothetical protein
MQVPTFHIGLFAMNISAFSVWSRWLFPLLVRGCHPRPFRSPQFTFDEREEGGTGRGDALLRHSITSPFKNARKKGSPSCSLTKRHRPRWSTTVGSSVFAAAQPRNRGLESERVSPFPAARISVPPPPFLGPLGHSPPVQARTSHTSHALRGDIRTPSPGE